MSMPASKMAENGLKDHFTRGSYRRGYKPSFLTHFVHDFPTFSLGKNDLENRKGNQ